jgi:hypothetical protein
MNIKKYIGMLALSACILISCNDEDTPSLAVYLPQADEVYNVQFQVSDDPYEVDYTVSLVGADFPTASVGGASRDIEIQFNVDASLVNIYNQGSGTNYTMLPENTYAIDASVTIPKGANSQELTLTITNQHALQPFQSYVLPVSIGNVTGASKSQYQQTLYFLVTATANASDMEAFDRSSWTIDSFSSEEASGEGSNNGHAIHAIDDDPDTFWHTQWQGEEPSPPHWIVIDMHESKLIHGLRLDPRNHWQGQPAVVKVEVSGDNKTWQDAGELNLMTTQYGSEDDLQHQEWSRMLSFFRTGRYVKITVVETMPDWNDSDAERPKGTGIAEIFLL